MGGRQTSPASIRRRTALFFTGTRTTSLEQQVYSVDYLHPGAPQRLTEPAVTNDASMDKRATHAAGHPLERRASRPRSISPTPTASASPGSRRTRSTPAHPYAPYLASHRLPTFGTIRRPGRNDALLEDAHAAAASPASAIPCSSSITAVRTASRSQSLVRLPLEQALVDRARSISRSTIAVDQPRASQFESAIYRSMGDAEVAGPDWPASNGSSGSRSSIRARSRSMAGPTAAT